MTNLDDRLRAIAHMMDEAHTYSKAEAFVWHELISHVDRDCFERTGRIRAQGPSPEIIARKACKATPGLNVDQVREALEHLRSRGHLVMENQVANGQVHYQLFLSNQTEAPPSDVWWGHKIDARPSRRQHLVFHDSLTSL